MQLRKKLTAVVTNMGQLDAVLQARGICRVYYEAAADLEKNLDKILAKCRKAGVTLYAALPREMCIRDRSINDAIMECPHIHASTILKAI